MPFPPEIASRATSTMSKYGYENVVSFFRRSKVRARCWILFRDFDKISAISSSSSNCPRMSLKNERRAFAENSLLRIRNAALNDRACGIDPHFLHISHAAMALFDGCFVMLSHYFVWWCLGPVSFQTSALELPFRWKGVPQASCRRADWIQFVGFVVEVAKEKKLHWGLKIIFWRPQHRHKRSCFRFIGFHKKRDGQSPPRTYERV